MKNKFVKLLISAILMLPVIVATSETTHILDHVEFHHKDDDKTPPPFYA